MARIISHKEPTPGTDSATDLTESPSASAASATSDAEAADADADAEEITMKQCKEVFQMFDRGAGNMLTKDLGAALRTLGQIPSDSEIEMIASRLEQEELFDKGETRINFQDFYQVVQENSERKTDIKEMVLDSFKTMDPEGTGFVEVAQLTAVLTSMGETLSSAEMREMLVDAGVTKEGKVDYIKFIDTVMGLDVISPAAAPAAEGAEGTNNGGKSDEKGKAAAKKNKR